MNHFGVIVENWKLPIFQKHLDAAEFKHEGEAINEETMMIKVYWNRTHAEFVRAKEACEAATKECEEVRN
jgi:hypothetical protein